MDWDAYAATWEAQEGVAEYADGAFRSLGESCGAAGLALAGARVCDFGCGTGLLTERLARAGATVLAVDTAAAMVAVLEAKRDRLDLSRVTTATVEVTAESVRGPLFTPPFDLVTASSVCAFVPDYPGTVAALASRLGPGGLFVQWDWELDPADGEDAHGLTRAEIEAVHTAAGLTVRRLEPAFTIATDRGGFAPLIAVGQTD